MLGVTTYLSLLQVWWELIVGHNPAFASQQSLDPLLLDIGELLSEVVGEVEGDDRESRRVRSDLAIASATLDRAVNVADDFEEAGDFQSSS